MRLLFGAHRPGFALVGVIKPGFLHDLAAIFQNGNLAAGFIVNRLRHEAHRVHVLDLAPGAEMAEILGGLILFILPRTADRHVDIRPQVAVLHVAVTGAQIAQDLAQFGDIGCRLLRPANVGARDNLHQGHAGAVEIDKGHGGVHVMDRLAGVLFQMNPLDPDQTGDPLAIRFGGKFDQHFTFTHDGVVKLTDLIALRQIGVEIVLAVKGRAKVDLRFQPKARPYGLFDAEFVDDRQHARHGGIDEGDVGIGFGTHLGGGARKQLGV